MLVLLASLLGGCLTSVGGPNEDRAEQFEFVPLPATRNEATEAFRDLFANDPMTLVEDSVTPIGKIITGQGPIVFAEFEMIDPEQGLQVCSGSAGPFSGGWGCRAANVPAPDDLDPREPLQAPAVGSTGTWSEVEFAVNRDVDHLTAVAADGTTYRLEPLAGMAWMEWKSEHGDLVVTAYDAAGDQLAVVDVEAP
jgi:hypothetical protein